MLEIFLYILIGAVAGVLSFLSCLFIWDIEFKQSVSSESASAQEEPKGQKAEAANTETGLYVPPEPALRSSISLHHEEIALTDEKKIISGSFIDVERKVDGVNTYQRVFLN